MKQLSVSRERLIDLLESFSSVPIMVIGDVILDRYIWGKVDRISPEAPVPIVEVKTVEDRLGGAANVAYNLHGLGCAVSVFGFVGDDDEGNILLSKLEGDGIDRTGMLVDGTRPTVLKTRVIAHSQQVVRVDRERRESPALALQEGFAKSVMRKREDHQAIVISDYGKGTIGLPLMNSLQEAQVRGEISLASCPLVVDPHPSSYTLYGRMTVAKPNRREAEIATGQSIRTPADALAACMTLQEKWTSSMVLITLGEDGSVLLDPTQPDGAIIPTEAREVFDVSGAGDTVTAVLAASLAVGASGIEAAVLANCAAGIVVSEVGTAAITKEKLLARLSERSDN